MAANMGRLGPDRISICGQERGREARERETLLARGGTNPIAPPQGHRGAGWKLVSVTARRDHHIHEELLGQGV